MVVDDRNLLASEIGDVFLANATIDNNEYVFGAQTGLIGVHDRNRQDFDHPVNRHTIYYAVIDLYRFNTVLIQQIR